MTPTFTRPNAAMFAYERSLMRPRRWPPTRHDVPTLWQRAKDMLGVAVSTVTSAADLFKRICFTRRQRRELAARVVPVEKLVRVLMMTEAAEFLLMTPEGRALREATQTIDPPAPPPPPPQPVGTAKPRHAISIEMPGWRTIAALQPYVDPRVVEREQREQREAIERRIAGLEALTQDLPESAGPSASDSENWRCRFNVLRWVHDRDDHEPGHSSVRMKPGLPAHRPRLITFDDSSFPIAPGLTVVDDKARAARDADDVSLNMGRDLARRIEALSRILANPAPAIRRLAHRLAALPADALPEPHMAAIPTHRWHHGVPECWNACALARPALRALARLFAWSTHKHDPG